MNQNNGPGDKLAIPLCVGLVVLGLWQGISKRAAEVRYDAAKGRIVGAKLTVEPLTAAGEFLANQDRQRWRIWALNPRRAKRALPRNEVIFNYATAKAIAAFNALVPFRPGFTCLSFVELLLLPLIFRRPACEPWGWVIHPIHGFILSVSGFGLAATIATSTSDWLGYPGLGLGLVELLVGFGLIARASPLGEEERKLKYGPPFALPADSTGKAAKRWGGVLAGRVDKDILPKHACWTANAKGDIILPFDRLSCSVTILGEKGSGKSRLLFAIHDAIRARFPERPILIHDPKYEWFPTYFNPDEDLEYAPHFHGSAHWDIWGDFQKIPELRHELISTAVYAHDSSGDDHFVRSAINILQSVSHKPTILHARKALLALKRKNGGNKTWMSAYEVARLAINDIAKVALPPPNGVKRPALSIDDFIRWKGRIILLNDPSCASEQRGAFSLFLAAFMLRLLSKPDVPAGQLSAAAIVDEALTFNLPPDVDRRIYALCRSKGLAVIAGAQRLPDRYKHERGEWATSEYLFGMKVLSQETQTSLSRRAGQIHFDQPREGKSVSEGRVSTSKNDQAERIEAMPPEHFGRLARREFILFHDGGLVTGRTADVDHVQRALEKPAYDPRLDVVSFMEVIDGVGGPTPGPDAELDRENDEGAAAPASVADN